MIGPGLQTLASMPIAPGVHAHSIIAVKGDGPPPRARTVGIGAHRALDGETLRETFDRCKSNLELKDSTIQGGMER